MPKQITTIKEFDGGLNTYSGTRDISEKECSSIQGFSVRKIGELLPLGGFAILSDSTVIDIIAADIATGSSAVTFDNGAEIFIFTTDHTRDNTEASDKWLVFCDKTDGKLYFHAATSSPLAWEYLDPDNIGEFKGIDGKLTNANMTAYDARDASYYFVDGNLRICDPNYNNATYVGDQSSSHGASSLWFGHIDRDYLGGVVSPNHWHCLPASLQDPIVGSGATTNFYNTLSFATGSGGPDVELGQFGLNVDIERNKGDGTLQFKGRKLYVTYTYDGVQESLPKPIGTIAESNLPDAPTNASLGYEQVVATDVDYGEENIPLTDDVRDLPAPYKSWDTAGTVLVTDDVGFVQTLTYTAIVDGTAELGNNNASTLTGVSGWVDNGSCDINYVVDIIQITNPGSGYSSVPTITIAAPTDGVTATANAVLTSGEVSSIVITNHGSGYDSPPAITFSSGAASAIASITGRLSTEALCLNNNGDWTASDILSTTTITFDVPGELEERDENLGAMFTLTVKPHDYSDGSNWGTSILDPKEGGNRVTHVNLYSNKYEDDLATIAQVEDMAFMCSFDLVNGYKKRDGSYNAWVSDDTLSSGNHTDQKSTYTEFIGSLLDDNYQSRTGMFPDTQAMDCRWLDAVVVNRRVYAGNVMTRDETGSYKSFPDKVLKSIPNSFDSFPFYDALDVVVDDGDEIVGLDSWGGKLLQFKKETLYLIDISTEPEFLAATFRYRGIPNKSAKIKTDAGVAFANANGVFLFNGESIEKLSKAKIDDDWQDYYSETICLGFQPKNGLILITNKDTAIFWLYDPMTKSWTKGSGNRHTDNDKSRFFIYNDEVTQAAAADDNSIEFYSYTDTYDASTMGDNSDEWTSREMDFNNPAGDSFVYNVKMTYKANNSTNVEVQFIGNNGSAEDTYDTNYSNGTPLPTTSNVNNTVEIKATSGAVRCKTFKIQLKESSGAAMEDTFVITDISIVYRDKRIK